MRKDNRVPVSKKRIKELIGSVKNANGKKTTMKAFCNMYLLSYEYFDRCLKKGFLSEDYARVVCSAFDVTPDELLENSEIRNPNEGLSILQRNNFYRGELATKHLLQILLQSKSNEELPQRQLSVWSGLLDDLLCVVLWHMRYFDKLTQYGTEPQLFKILEEKYCVPLWEEYKKVGANIFQNDTPIHTPISTPHNQIQPTTQDGM